MATYREIHGKAIKSVSTDPSAPTDAGQVWYNTTSNTFKSILNLEAWSSGSPLITARGRNQGAGTQTAGLSFGGMNPPTLYANTEEYNGTGWTTGGALPTTIFDHAGDGTQTSAFSAGGQPTDPGSATTATCSYNGTSWTSLPALSTARKKITGLGASSTAALVFGGQIEPPGASTNASEEYSGSSWTTGGTMNSIRSKSGGAGTQTAGLGFGGYMPSSGPGSPGVLANTETYDGTSWSEVNDMNTARNNLGGFGTQTSALGAGGNIPAQSTATETWDGTNWTTSPATLGTATVSMSSAGTTSGGWIAGGYNPPGATGANTEEYNSSVSAVTAGAWAAGGNLNTARARAGGMLGSDSTQNASMAFGGQAGTAVQNKNEEYNGTSWAESGDLGTARRWHYGAGSQTAALCAGGVTSAAASPVVGNTEEYDGSSWSEVTNMGTGRYNGGSGGIQTAAFVTGGSPAPSYTDATEEYDGTNWTAGGAMLVSKGYYGGGGTLTAGIVMGMSTGSKSSYEYDGSSWTAGGTMVRGGSQSTYAGLQTDGISFGGTPTTLTEGYDGTAWSTRPSMGTARYALAGKSGTSTSALGCGGEVTPQTNATEEFTGETTAVNVKTLTQS